MLALDPNFGGILHWGQRNLSSTPEIQARFGDAPTDPTGPWLDGVAHCPE